MIKIKNQKSKIKITNKNSKILNLGLSFCILIFGFLTPLLAQEKIIAIVNDDIITYKDLNDFITFTRVQLSGEFKGKQLEEKLQSMRPDMIEKLIEDRLILQEAKKNNIKADENRLKAKINEIKTRYSTDADFQNTLVSQGLTQADIEKKIREQMLMFGIVEQKVKSKIITNPDEITNFYEQNKATFRSPETRQLDVIILEKEDTAKSFSDSLKTGKKLTELTAQYPATIDSLTISEEEELKTDVKNIIFKLSLNEVSPPTEIGGKYYIFRLLDITAPKQLSLPETQTKISSLLLEKKMREEMTRWLDELKKKSYIKIM